MQEYLEKIKHWPERVNIADQAFILTEVEEKNEKPDNDIFPNGCMLLFGLGWKEQLKRFIGEYKDLLDSASGLDEINLDKLVELGSTREIFT